ncbi:hypothetical protein M3Y95_00679200 [Aphelenchoides besseyi]|nr:hypothetical protein M3Y95_00679200 [Aphelenchoides besseyi]
MNSTIEAEFEPIHPKSLFVAFAPLSSKHQNNDSIDLELTTANNVKFKVNGLFVQSCTQSPLVIPIPKMNDNHDFISRLRLSVPTNYYIVTIGLLVDSVYYSKAVQQCLQIGNPSISTTKSKCIYSTPTPSTSLNCRPIPLNEYIDANCFNDICQIKCKSGLQMSNGMKFEMRCTPNGWMGLKMFDLVSHFCIPVDCGKPLTIPSMNVNCLNGYNLGAECEVKCQPNALSYPLYRQSSSIECLKSGVWSAPELICIDACSVDEFDNWNVNRTSLICHSELNHLFGQSNSGYWPMGSECSGRCKLGYHLETNQSHDTLLRCSNASNWSGPKCVRKHCPLTSTYHQALDCTDGANVGSECRFNCSTEMGPRIRSIFCLPNARWSQRFACPLKPKGYCEIPTMPTNLVVKCPKYVAFGTNCSIECRSKGYDVVVETHRPQFKFQQITNLTCKSNGLLVARFANLKCLRSCNEEFFGDDWCDFQNNRQYCHFDGGDCCNSTVSTRRVRVMFQMLCTSHLCQCIDPMAVENRGLRLFDPNEGLWFGRRLRSTRHIDANNHDVSYANPSLQIVRSVELIALQSSRTNNHFGLLTRLHENWRQRRPKVEMHENNFMTND